MGGLKMGELLIIFAVVLIFFGGAKLPQLGASLGQAIRNFKRGFGGEETEEEKKSAAAMTSGNGAQQAESDRARAAAASKSS